MLGTAGGCGPMPRRHGTIVTPARKWIKGGVTGVFPVDSALCEVGD